jgi:hypothetical protein
MEKEPMAVLREVCVDSMAAWGGVGVELSGREERSRELLDRGWDEASERKPGGIRSFLESSAVYPGVSPFF